MLLTDADKEKLKQFYKEIEVSIPLDAMLAGSIQLTHEHNIALNKLMLKMFEETEAAVEDDKFTDYMTACRTAIGDMIYQGLQKRTANKSANPNKRPAEEVLDDAPHAKIPASSHDADRKSFLLSQRIVILEKKLKNSLDLFDLQSKQFEDLTIHFNGKKGQLKADIIRLKIQLESLGKQLTEEQGNRRNFEEKNSKLQQKIDRLRAEKQPLGHSPHQAALESLLSEKNEILATQNARLDELITTNSTLKQQALIEKERVIEEKTRLETENMASQEKIIALENEIGECQHQLQALREEKLTFEGFQAAWAVEKEQLLQQLESLNLDIKLAENEIALLGERLSLLDRQTTVQANEYNAAKETFDVRLAELEAEKAALNQSVQALNEQRQEQDARILELSGAQSAYVQEYNQLIQEKHNLSATIDAQRCRIGLLEATHLELNTAKRRLLDSEQLLLVRIAELLKDNRALIATNTQLNTREQIQLQRIDTLEKGQHGLMQEITRLRSEQRENRATPTSNEQSSALVRNSMFSGSTESLIGLVEPPPPVYDSLL